MSIWTTQWMLVTRSLVCQHYGQKLPTVGSCDTAAPSDYAQPDSFLLVLG